MLAPETDGRKILAELLPKRKEDTHKGHYGRLALLCGSVGLTGAPFFAAESAVRAGAGLVGLLVPADIYQIAAVKLNEAMPYPVPCDSGTVSEAALPEIQKRFAAADACLAGCGLGTGDGVKKIIRTLISAVSAPMVLDADGINALSGHIDLIGGASCPLVLTPHDGELSRLLRGEILKPGEGRPEAAVRIAKSLNAVLVMKGHKTVVASPEGRVYINNTGNPGMAKGGSGDVLAGIITAFIGQSGKPFESAAAGVFVHGLAGDMARDVKGEIGMTPTDILEKLPEAIRTCRGR
jgi:hydroxyethylthiazole kinase-like uncharacterized protein yjeF